MHKSQDLKNIRAFWSLEVVNKETNAIINRAHTTYLQNNGVSPGRTLVWPGVTFPMDSMEGQAILGELFTCLTWGRYIAVVLELIRSRNEQAHPTASRQDTSWHNINDNWAATKSYIE